MHDVLFCGIEILSRFAQNDDLVPVSREEEKKREHQRSINVFSLWVSDPAVSYGLSYRMAGLRVHSMSIRAWLFKWILSVLIFFPSNV